MLRVQASHKAKEPKVQGKAKGEGKKSGRNNREGWRRRVCANSKAELGTLEYISTGENFLMVSTAASTTILRSKD